ncbi:MAG: 2OG-Fe(II) oxygenase [Paucibacter sp.]|nr:2OG-Fe(II) oxygenase [Roseateles sp.]
MTFIGEYYIDEAICGRLIKLFESSQSKAPGKSFRGTQAVVDKNIKDSTDVLFNQEALRHNPQLAQDYYGALANCAQQYEQEYTFLQHTDQLRIVESPILQHYAPGQGYKQFHFERGSMSTAARYLAFMTYLNTVTDQGGTEFYYQKLVHQPKVGKTLIWPVDWTHTHRGVISPTQDKFIVTGWFSLA